ncbi:hypothetical protein, partial [Elizabethkingia miricola]
FNIRTEMITEENGDKSIIFPKVRGNKVIGLVEAVLTKQETHMSYYTYNSESSLYKDYKDDFQDALDRYQSRRQIKLSASIKPMADTEIEGVVITVKRKKKEDIGTVRPPEEGGSCPEFANCIAYNPGGGGGNDMPSPEIVDKIDITELKEYPCAFAIAQELPYMDNNIAQLLSDTFGKDNGINVTFVAADLVNADGGTNMIGDKNKFEATIRLDKGMLAQATQEYMLATMYHEVVHAYLLFEQTRLGVSAFNESYPGVRSYDVTMKDGTTSRKFEFIQAQNHNRMGPFINGLKNSILKFNPNYPPERAEALAMWGIITEESIPKGYASYNAHERESSTAALGKKCNK